MAKALRCENSRGTIYHRERRIARAAGCGRWSCRACGQYKARKVADRFSRLGADYFITLTLPPGRGWPTDENYRYLQTAWRWFSRYLQRHKLVAAYGWVGEVSAEKPECVCLKPNEARARGVVGPSDCLCGIGGNRLHRHMLVKLGTAANRFGRKWLPYEALQAAAKRCGLGTIDCRPVFSIHGATRYVSKYLTKSIAVAPTDRLGARRRRFAMNVRIEETKESGWAFSFLRPALVAVEYLGAIAVDWDADYWSPAYEPS